MLCHDLLKILCQSCSRHCCTMAPQAGQHPHSIHHNLLTAVAAFTQSTFNVLPLFHALISRFVTSHNSAKPSNNKEAPNERKQGASNPANACIGRALHTSTLSAKKNPGGSETIHPVGYTLHTAHQPTPFNLGRSSHDVQINTTGSHPRHTTPGRNSCTVSHTSFVAVLPDQKVSRAAASCSQAHTSTQLCIFCTACSCARWPDS